MVKCLKCGEEHPAGSYHFIHCGIMFKNDRKEYEWNCNLANASSIFQIEEKILDDYMNKSKTSSLLIYE